MSICKTRHCNPQDGFQDEVTVIIQWMNYECACECTYTRLFFYRCPEHHNCQRMSSKLQAFYMIKCCAQCTNKKETLYIQQFWIKWPTFLMELSKRWGDHKTDQQRGSQIFPKSRSHLKILGAWRLIWNTFHTKDKQILDATIQNLVAQVTWCLGFVHLCTSSIFFFNSASKIPTAK
jgi:hypothetical protein